MRPFVPVEKSRLPSRGDNEKTISSLDRHRVLTVPSGWISKRMLCALASAALRRPAGFDGVADDVSGVSTTSIVCPANSDARTVTLTVASPPPELVVGVAGAGVMKAGRPLRTAA